MPTAILTFIRSAGSALLKTGSAFSSRAGRTAISATENVVGGFSSGFNGIIFPSQNQQNQNTQQRSLGAGDLFDVFAGINKASLSIVVTRLAPLLSSPAGAGFAALLVVGVVVFVFVFVCLNNNGAIPINTFGKL